MAFLSPVPADRVVYGSGETALILTKARVQPFSSPLLPPRMLPCFRINMVPNTCTAVRLEGCCSVQMTGTCT
jgi:hypothetical protein